MDIVKVRFYDHCWGTKVNVPICTVYGEYCEELSDPVCMVVRVWRTDHDDDVYDAHDGNQEYACIVRKTIIEISHLAEMSDMVLCEA